MVRAAGGEAPRSRLGQVWLNGGFHNGVMVFEGVDESFLRSRFEHAEFDLIKGKPLDVKLGTFDGLDLTEPGAKVALCDDGVAPPVRPTIGPRVGISVAIDRA